MIGGRVELRAEGYRVFFWRDQEKRLSERRIR